MDARDNDISTDLIRECLAYDETSLTPIWKVRPRHHFKTDLVWKQFNSQFAGKPAGSPHGHGYLRFGLVIPGVRKRHIHAHRAAYVLMTGAWPTHKIDHRDGDFANNRWSNIRPATDAENGQNRRVYRNNKSGFTGVFHRAKLRSNPYFAAIRIGTALKHLGCFPTAEEARAAYLKAKAELHPFQPLPRS